MNIYFDNAATTPMDPLVVESMLPYFTTFFGNPSSTHKKGREVRAKIEQARKQIANSLNASPSEIFFTSCATEANNTILKSVVDSHKIENVISSSLEHHAVLHVLQFLEDKGKIKLHFVNHNNKGELDLIHLKELLQTYSHTLVSIMHANNEIGNLNPISEISALCKEYEAFFHSDTVQTIGHYQLDVKVLGVDSLVGSAHKFHGPKGVGVLYIKSSSHVEAFLHGGAQERGFRAGTENVAGIIGMTKALEITYTNLEEDKGVIFALKKYLIEQLTTYIQGVTFNGNSNDLEKSLYSIVSISLPPLKNSGMLLFNLDLHNISISGGSACSSGAQTSSHVLEELQEANLDEERPVIRCSFSKYNTKEEIDYFVGKLSALYN